MAWESGGRFGMLMALSLKEATGTCILTFESLCSVPLPHPINNTDINKCNTNLCK
jgi:hypothetical protein